MKPVILLGNGARGTDLTRLLAWRIPILTSWNSKDLVDNNHEWYLGSPGIYGQRIANKVLYEADTIIALGNRMAIWNVGYEGPRKDQRVVMVDVDDTEAEKCSAVWVDSTVDEWVRTATQPRASHEWRRNCRIWKDSLPLIEKAHADTEFINSYRFVDALHKYLRPDEVIVTDMGTAHICAAQVLRLKPPQRFISSGGLGEMGCGLPMAIGAAKVGEVLCLVGDGGLMLNLQEMQTIVHYKLPVKIIVFSNDGYGMIRETQKKASKPYVGVNAASGVSCPSFRKLAHAWGMPAAEVKTWRDFDQAIPALFAEEGPALVEFHMNPEQKMVPKLDPIYVDGKPTSPRFCDMSPRLS